MNALFVGLGGAVGAVGRYGLSLLPCRSAFPILTLLTNLIGAVLIGYVAGLAGRAVSYTHLTLPTNSLV